MTDVVYWISGKMIYYVTGVTRICRISGHCQIARGAIDVSCMKRGPVFVKDGRIFVQLCAPFVRRLVSRVCCTHKWQRERWYVKSLPDRNVFATLRLKVHYVAVILRSRASQEAEEKEREKRYLLAARFYFIETRVQLVFRSWIISRSVRAWSRNNDARCYYRDTSMSAINVGAAGSRTHLTREPSAKQMQRDQCQGCASSSGSCMLLRLLLQVLQQISRAAARDERRANSSSQVHGT